MRWLMAGMLILSVSTARVHAQDVRWNVDAALITFTETWDLNGAAEQLPGATIGLDAQVWRRLAIRGEGLLLRVRQLGADTWLRGATLATRVRGCTGRVQPFVEIGGGVASAARPVPPTGTRFNYLLLAGGGVEVPVSRAHVAIGFRWFHLSNNGREGRHRNPDIQSLGGFAGMGWRF